MAGFPVEKFKRDLVLLRGKAEKLPHLDDATVLHLADGFLQEIASMNTFQLMQMFIDLFENKIPKTHETNIDKLVQAFSYPEEESWNDVSTLKTMYALIVLWILEHTHERSNTMLATGVAPQYLEAVVKINVQRNRELTPYMSIPVTSHPHPHLWETAAKRLNAVTRFYTGEERVAVSELEALLIDLPEDLRGQPPWQEAAVRIARQNVLMSLGEVTGNPSQCLISYEELRAFVNEQSFPKKGYIYKAARATLKRMSLRTAKRETAEYAAIVLHDSEEDESGENTNAASLR